jgi:hypothetical protein
MLKSSEIAWVQQLEAQASTHDNQGVTPSLSSQFQFPMDNSIAFGKYDLDYQNISNRDVTNT